MPVQNEKRVLWHPRHTDKFVVGGASQITLYELSDEQPEIRHVTSQHDLQFMKCFAWSPAKIPSDIFAVGHSSGRVDLLRLEASRYSQLGPDESVLAAGPILSLPVRNQRSCNALAFCPSDPNYLAVGLDKVSRDSSLVIWDVQEEIGVFRAAINLADDANVMSSFSKESFGKLSTYPPIPRTDYPVRADQRIVQAHAQTEVISSLAWLSQSTHPYLLLAGISSRWLRLFDLRNPAGSVAGVSYVSSIAAKVTGIATDPFDGTRFLTWGDGVVTIWDTRKLQTSKIHSDFANGAPSPTPLLTFSEKDAGVDDSPSTLVPIASKLSVTSSPFPSSKTKGVSAPNNYSSPVVQQSSYVAAEFSPSRRGIIATLAKDANYVRLWDVLEAGGSSMRREVEDVDEKIIKLKDKAPVSRKSWANLPWGNSINSLESKDPSSVHEGENIEQSRHPTLILHNARRAFASSAPNPLCSFAIVPPVYSSHQSKSKLVVVSQSGEITVQSVYNAARTLTWSSRGDMLYGPLEFVNKDNSNAGFGVVNGHHEEQEERDMEEHIHTTSGVQASPNLAGSTPNSKSFVASEQKELHERGRPRNPISFQEILPSPALFGRGDAEGFPALSRPLGENHISANLAATKPVDGHGEEKKRTYSPAAALRVPLRATNALSSPSISAIPHDGLSTPVKLPESKESVVESRKTFISDVAATDVSVLMRRRAMRGYSIRDPLRNASVIRELARSRNSTTTMEFEEPTKESKMLADLWEWIYHSQNFLSSPTPLLHGYDFSFAGVWGIWDGPASNGGSGIISRYRDLSAHNTETSTNMFGSHSSNSGSNASGSVSSSLTGSISTSPGSSMRLGGASLVLGNIGDAEATPVHRDRLELPLVMETEPLYRTMGRSRRGQAQNMLSGSKRTRTRSPVTKLANDTEWHQALLDLFARTTEPLPASRLPIFPYISTSQPLQRHICLHLIGWGFVVRDDSLMAEVRRWEQESEGDEGYARAAAWLVFTGRYGGGVGVSNEGAVYSEGAIECLLRSEDESHHMMSGVIAALAPFASATLSSLRTTSKLVLPSPLREHYARLINRLQNSYLRALLTHLTAISSSAAPNPEHWLEILHDEEDLLPFYERLALAFCFLDDTALSTYLRRCREHALSKNGGDVDALVVTGLGTPEGREIISLWLDRLGDVQSAALLGWTGLGLSSERNTMPNPIPNHKAEGRLMPKIDSRVIRWVESYRDFLDSVKLFHCRVEFDIERGETLQITLDHRTTGSAPRQILIRCNYCNKTVASNTGVDDINILGPGQESIPQGKPTTCPNCGRALPRCSICLMTLGIVPDAYREIELSHSQYRDTMDDAILLCLGCRHGGHASHILQWFFGQDGAILSHRLCPVADCAHQCGNEF